MTAPYTINTTIPAGSHTPAQDYSGMQVNYANINGFLGVDHTAPGTSTQAGQHDKVRLTSRYTASAQTDPQSLIYSGIGSINSTTSQLFFLNSNTTGDISSTNPGFLLNAIRGFGCFTISADTLTPTFLLNCTASRTDAGVYGITMTNGSVVTNTFAVLVSCNIIGSYVITGNGTFNILTGLTTSSQFDAVNVSFAVLQW